MQAKRVVCKASWMMHRNVQHVHVDDGVACVQAARVVAMDRERLRSGDSASLSSAACVCMYFFTKTNEGLYQSALSWRDTASLATVAVRSI